MRARVPASSLLLGVALVAVVLFGLAVCGGSVNGQEPRARISEELRALDTYPFSQPDPVPILVRDTRLYPYHRFTGYAHDSTPREWKVVHLENDHIELWVLPQIGGKVWGARVKQTGHEFIYRNEVVKFRNIALRGPWTSGGIEFNFGVIGHTPATATPVDYLTRENDDGSVSVFVGAMDLPTRTRWRVEVRLPADRAYFETNVVWQNPTPLEQPYYNWMTGAAFAQDDLVMSIPGNAYLGHPGERHAWPVDDQGRDLSVYDQNRFGGNKSFHVVGELEDFFGGYYLDDDYGFGHWARHEEMPGQKLWLWALSRQGGIWEDLLTDTDGQYIEFQAGRLLVQYSRGEEVNPISEVGFGPGATDRWSETWFPVERLGGLTDASREGAMHVSRTRRGVRVRAHSFGRSIDTLRVSLDGVPVAEVPVTLRALEPMDVEVELPDESSPVGGQVIVALPGLGLRYDSDPAATALRRPFGTDPEALPSLPEAARLVTTARQSMRAGRLPDARSLFERAMALEPWNRDALLGLADAEYRRGRFEAGSDLVQRSLQLDAYDPEANFVAGMLHRAANRSVDAVEAFGWSARSMQFRSVSYLQLAELELGLGDLAEAERYASLSVDYDRHGPGAYEVLAIVGRLRREQSLAESALAELARVDPLHHFVRAERYLTGSVTDTPEVATEAQEASARFLGLLRGEFPEQEILELALAYERRGRTSDAVRLLRLGRTGLEPATRGTAPGDAMLRLWTAYLTKDATLLGGGVQPDFVFPYRIESIDALEWAVANDTHWSWRYLLGLNLWGRDRAEEAYALFERLGGDPDSAPFYVSRAHLAELVGAATDPEADLRRAVFLSPGDRGMHVGLVQYLQRHGRWSDALSVSGAGRERFEDDFDLALLHVQSLNEMMRFREAIEILDRVRVLPSEHAGDSHRLFAEAHTMAALAAMDEGAWDDAERHLDAAMTWPERLGLGRPYEPEERLQRYLKGIVLARSGRVEAGRSEWGVVVSASRRALVGDLPLARLDLLGASAAAALDETSELADFGSAAPGALGRVATMIRDAAVRGADVAAVVGEASRSEPSLFADVEGRLLLRAVTYAR